MDLLAGAYSDSSDADTDREESNEIQTTISPPDDSDNSELEDVDKGDVGENSDEPIPLPDFDLNSSGMGTSRKAIDPKVP